ncbi:Putative oxidoreductase C terminal domain-containing protein [bacterium A37T11]|nr:Putative oxidoreductase C terminal domain-containing protein [bacterium A37T11]
MKNPHSLLKLLALMLVLAACTGNTPKTLKEKAPDKVKFITLAPGHFHAALVQKFMVPGEDSVVHVYAPEGPDVEAHLNLIKQFNTRPEEPTHWDEVVYKGPDFLSKMLSEKKGNVVVLAGNNRDKINYITQSIQAGLNVLSDKPMVIDTAGFKQLEKDFATAAEKNVLLYDIMTERYEINSTLQREFSRQPEFFGGLITGTPAQPAVTKESVHHFFKVVSGNPLTRPTWYFDVKQQGEGIVDVTTHLIDLVQWECYPEQTIDYKKDIELLSAKRWPTLLSKEQFAKVTGQDSIPAFLKSNLDAKGQLAVFSNGEINYKLKGTYAKVSVIWNFQAPEGTGDTHYSIMRGKNANLIIKQGAEQNYKPVFYVEPATKEAAKGFEASLKKVIEKLKGTYAGLTYSPDKNGLYKIGVDPSLVTVHEQHFAQVTQKYLGFLKTKSLPAWEVPNILAKYYLSTLALSKAETVK